MENIIYLPTKNDYKMKKLILAFLIGLLLISCGKDKKKEIEATQQQTAFVSDKYSVIIDGIYEKDDTISVVYQKNDYYLYDKPLIQVVKGSASAQRLTFLVPEGDAIENVSICLSKNKSQDYITIKNVSIKNANEVILDGSNNNFSNYLATDTSFTWDVKNSRYILNHSNKYPPSIVGNDKLQSLLVK